MIKTKIILKKGEHLIIRRDINDNEKRATDFSTPDFLILKDFSAINKIKVDSNYSYFLISHTTTEPVSEYVSTLPKRYKKRFLMLELEQHKGEKLTDTITEAKRDVYYQKHNELIPSLHSDKCIFTYSTGGGLNLIYFLDVDEKVGRKARNTKKDINTIIEVNAYDTEENPTGIYDGGYHTSVTNMKWLRLPLEGTKNPKYGNTFTGLIQNEGAEILNYSSMGDNKSNVVDNSIEAKIQDIYIKQRELKITKAETKSTYENLIYLEELGYAIGEANTCIHPNHPDDDPSMIVYADGTAECKSGRADHHFFSIRDLVEARGGDIERVNLYSYLSDDIKLDGSEINNDILRIALRHIERKRLFFLSKDVHSKGRVYNFNQNRWDISSWSDVLFVARGLMSDICKATLGIISRKGFTVDELKGSKTYKNIQKNTTFLVNGTHLELERGLLATISTNAQIKDICTFSQLPPERAWAIPFKNGVFNAVTGKLEKMVAEDYILSKVNIDYKYHTENEYKEILDLLNEWTGGEGRELATGLARSLSRQESGKMIILIGSGGNGKSVLISEILNNTLIDDKSGYIRGSSLGLQTLTTEDTFNLVDLVGKSVNISSEVQTEHGTLDGLKDKTMGADYIRINVKHKDGFTIKPEATFILVGNSIPFIKLDPAMIRRLQIFEFKNDYTEIGVLAIRAFERKIRSKEFRVKFFSYLASIFHETALGNIVEQDNERVKHLIRKYNNILRALLEEEYVIGTADEYVALSGIISKMDAKATELKKGKSWTRQGILRVLGELGYNIDVALDAVYGLRNKNDGNPIDPIKPKKEETVIKKEKGHKKKSIFAQRMESKASLVTEQAELTEAQKLMKEFSDNKPLKPTVKKSFTVAPESVFEKVNSLLGDKLTGRKIIALDIETTGLIPSRHEVATIQIRLEDGTEEFIETKRFSKEAIETKLKGYLTGQAVLGYNIAFDFGFLAHHYNLDPISNDIYILDAMLAAKLDRQATSVADELESENHMDLTHYRNSPDGYFKKFGLKDSLWFYLQVELSKEEQKSDWSGALTQSQKEYAMNDVRYLHELYTKISKKCTLKGMDLVLKIEEMTTPAIIDANAHTLTIDIKGATELESKYKGLAGVEIAKYNGIMEDVAGSLFPSELDMLKSFREFKGQKIEATDNKNAKDLQKLIDKNGIFCSKAGGMFKYLMSKTLGEVVKSTDKKAIKKLMNKHEIFPQIQAMTQLIKKYEDIKRTIHNRTEDNRVITKLNQIGTVTGRMSSSGLKDNNNKKVGINMQQINNSDEFRDIFVAPEGKKLILADYAGMELRIVSKIANETTMLNAFKNNEDLHTKTASILFKESYEEMVEVLKDSDHPRYKEFKTLRNKSKSINFLITYGGGATALSDGANVTIEEAKSLIAMYKTDVYPMLGNYIQTQNNTSEVFSALGRMINSDEVINDRKLRAIENSDFAWKASKYTKRSGGLFSIPQFTNPVNFPIQSTGSDIVKLALVFITQHTDFTRDAIHITHIVHDEIILEVKDALTEKWKIILQDVMELAGNIVMDNKVFMKADASIGTTWSEAK